MNKVRKAFYILSWIPVILLFSFPLLPLLFVGAGAWAFLPIGLFFLGLIAVPIALIRKQWPRALWLWGNDEEGCPDWWLSTAATGVHGKVAQWLPRFWWYAIRNPVNNFRFLLEDTNDFHIETNWDVDEPMEAGHMQTAGQQMAYAWRWRGWQSGYRRVWLNDNLHYSEIWFGWKLGSSVPGLGFTSQVRLKRTIGT